MPFFRVTAARELDAIIWSVADRFGFGAEEIWRMPVSRLRWWYKGARELAALEKKAAGGNK